MTTKKQIVDELFNGDVNETTEALYQRVTTDPALHAEWIEPLIREWCRDTVSDLAVRKPRQAVWNGPAWTPEVNAESNERLKTFARSLLDFPLPGGLPLRHATKDDLIAASEFYEKQANDMLWKAKWLKRIIDGMGRKRTVGNAMTDEQLERLKQETV